MMIDVIINILVLATLIFIAVKLHKISKELSRNLKYRSKVAKDGETLPSGQTINVNLSPFSADNSTIVSPPKIVSENPLEEESEQSLIEEIDEDSKDDKAKEVPTKNDVYANNVNVSPNGVMYTKCKSCDAENSTYRRECFNCGKSL